MELPTPVIELLKDFDTHDIFLIEWENELLARLGYPIVPIGDLFFLVPDEQLSDALNLAANHGYYPADKETLRLAYPSEHSHRGLRFVIHDPGKIRNNLNPKKRLVLLPLSWTGITKDEVTPLSTSDHCLPCKVHTVPISVACAALVRIASLEKKGTRLRSELLGHLSCVIAYRYFDLSYEGNYLEITPDDQPWSAEEVLEMENAVKELGSWKMRQDEEWIRRELIRAMTGEISYRGLPWTSNGIREFSCVS